MERGAGILMHIASLPGEFGIGTLGKEAYKFADFLNKSGIKNWQILPIGHTSYGDSPYQCFSAFAGNPYFIDFDMLRDQGILKEEDYKYENYGKNPEKIDYALIFDVKYKVLKKAYKNFIEATYLDDLKKKFEVFKDENKFWLEDYSLYMAVKNSLGLISWHEWDEDIKLRKPEAMKKYKEELADEIIYFNSLGKEVQFKIVDKMLNNLKERLKSQYFLVDFSENVMRLIQPTFHELRAVPS